METFVPIYTLLTDSELTKLDSIKFYGARFNTSTNFQALTIAQLSQLSWVLIESVHNDKMPSGVLSSIAIDILTQRAIERNISLF